MAKLECSVVSCVYNDDYLCRKDTIKVAGREAAVSEETCCESFEMKHGDSSSNSCGCAEERTAIECSAEECIYNDTDRCVCRAEAIDVGGSHACTCYETKCATFEKK